ncbi:MAG: hypothetical protein H6721_04025 [Sandaracinus sp.]|nr:hypothetical protein [Sandaracinus sp.]
MRVGAFRHGLGVLAVMTALMGGFHAGCASDTGEVTETSAQLEATFVGRADDGETFVAVVRSGTSFLIYACDDTRDAWFRAEVLASPMELTDALGNTVLLALDEGDEGARGAITFGDSEAIAFALERTEEEVLFRAEGVLSGDPLLGGWIRLPDGEQRGVVRRDTTMTTSRLTSDVPVVVASPAGMQRLGPAAFTPRALQAPTRARPAPFELFGLGDSYGAGEGAPEIPGDFEDDGSLRDGGDREEWNASLTDADARREARACHRSGVSGIEVAADILRQQYQGALDVRLAPLACSGAQSEHFHTCDYRGAIGDHYTREEDFQDPQITRMKEIARLSGVDAVYMSIGGNDMRFGPIVSACIKEALLGEGIAGDICGEDTPIDREMARIVEEMPERYGRIADELEGLLPSRNVYLSQYPNPLADENGRPCSEVDIFRFGGLGVMGGDEVAWLSSTVVPRLNDTVARNALANGWQVVRDHVEFFRGHGYCSDDPWFVDNPTSLRLQGRAMTDSLNAHDFPLDTCIDPRETRESVGDAGPTTVAGGVVHPNADGYANGYGPAIAEALRGAVRPHVTPRAVGSLRIQAQRAEGNVLIAWDDRSSTETEYRVMVRPDVGRSVSARLPADSTAYEIALSGAARGQLDVTPCFVGPAPARREICGETATITYANVTLRRAPLNVRVDTAGQAAVPAADFRTTPAHRAVRVRWTSGEVGAVYYDVEIENSDGSRARRASTELSFLATAQLRTARVRACNYLGCTGPSAVVNGPACAEGEVFSLDRTCVPGQALVRSTRDLQCEQAQLAGDPGGICRR